MKQTVFPYTSLIEINDDYSIIFGGHIEFHKVLFSKKIKCPEIIVIPDTLVRDSLPQINLEFFLYAFLFIRGNFDFKKGVPLQKLKIIGNKKNIEGAKDLLRLSFLGPSDNELHTKWRINKDIRMMLRSEMDYFALKDMAGNNLLIDDFVELFPWDNDKVAFDDITINHQGTDKYIISKQNESIKIDFADLNGIQQPSWSPVYSCNHEKICKFGIKILGSSSGFDFNNPSTSYLLYLNHERYLWDCAPFIGNMLEGAGISIYQIKGIFVSHIHDDHVIDIIRFMRHGKFRIEIITTAEIKECFIKKISVLTGLNKETILARFKWRIIKPGVSNFINGYRFDWHYGVHSIPAIGVTISRDNKILVISGDTAFKSVIKNMLDKKILSKQRYDSIISLPEKGWAIMDAGEAIIHGAPKDYIESRNKDNIILAHCASLSDEYKDDFSVAYPGMTHIFEPGNYEAIDSGVMKSFLDSIGVEDSKWLVLFMEEKEDILLSPEESITDKQEGLFVVANGIIDFYLDGQFIQSLFEGEYFGFFTYFGIPWQAKARSGSRVLKISIDILDELMEAQSNFSNVKSNFLQKKIGDKKFFFNSNFKFMDYEFSFKTSNIKNNLYYRFIVSLIGKSLEFKNSAVRVKKLNALEPLLKDQLGINQIGILKKGAISMRRPGLKGKIKRYFFAKNTIIKKNSEKFFSAHCKEVIKEGEIKAIEPLELLIINIDEIKNVQD
jgi:hypothetical protein